MLQRPRVRVRLTTAERQKTRPHLGPTLLDAIADPNLFAPWFKDTATWQSWFAFIAALFALDMTPEQLAVYRQCTGRNDPPTEPAREAWLVCGRRAGKSFILALCAVYLACFRDYRKFLAPGERGTVFVIATDRKQARIILRYIRALLTQVPMLARMIERDSADGFDLSNSTTLEVATASYRSVRGYSIVAALADEIAFWADSETSANPDYEILNALRPAMATTGGIMLCASSPYSRKGALWDAHRSHFAKEGDRVLVFQAPTRFLNPSVPQSFIDGEYERDPANAAAEFGAQFRSDIAALVDREAVEAVVPVGVRERPPIQGIRYSAFVDPSGGSSDSFTLAIVHQSDDKVAVLDAVRERKPPFSPEDVVAEFAELLRRYGVMKIVGDRYAGEFPRELFRKFHITYDPSAKPKSDLYRELLPLINGRTCDLLDNPKLVAQITGLERRVARSGRDSIDHAPGGHDDLANCVAGALTNLTTRRYKYLADLSWVMEGNVEDEFRAVRLQQHITGGYR